MKAITPVRARLLHAILHLSKEFRRPPSSAEVAGRLDLSAPTVRAQVIRARRDGQIHGPASISAMAPSPLRITPQALAALRAPVVVYLAWKMNWACPTGYADAAEGARIATQLHEIGIIPVSPCFIPGLTSTALHAVATKLAVASDAVIAVGDPLLAGREDVATARLHGIPVALVDDLLLGVTSADQLWIPPILLPPVAL